MNKTFDEHIRERCSVLLGYPSVYVDYEKELVTFLCWSIEGKLKSTLVYNWLGDKKARGTENAKYLSFGDATTFGLDCINPCYTVYVVEGVWDALTLRGLGYQALALKSNNTSKEVKKFLRKLITIAVCDGDYAGRKIAKLTDRAIFLPEGSDPNSIDKRSLIKLLEDNKC